MRNLGRGVTKQALSFTAAFILMVTIAVGAASAQSTVTTQLGTSRYAGEFEVAIHKSQILRVDTQFSDLLVGNSKVADVVPLTNRTVYILGKTLGTTSLSIYGKGKSLLAIVDVVVTHNVEGLKKRLFDLMPEEKIEVRTVNDAVVLSGSVSSAAKVAQAVALAERYAEAGKVTNMLTATGSQQVMLAVRFAEMKRSAFKDIGINTSVLAQSGSSTFQLLTGFATTGFGLGGASIFGQTTQGKFTVDGLLDALERKGVVKTLAEPNLIALSGDTASFLAGGEFPIPVASETSAGQSTITIEFKQFGVSLAFTPTVLNGGLISLKVAPEVSAIDPAASVTLNNISVPGLTTRRAETTVEMHDGQSFAIAGLLQSEFKNGTDQLPFLGDVPVLGALFRSADYQHDETELVIIVTPYLVKPVKKDNLALPTDTFLPPSEAEFFLFGQLEKETGGTSAKKKKGHVVLGGNDTGGLDGKFGHIIK